VVVELVVNMIKAKIRRWLALDLPEIVLIRLPVLLFALWVVYHFITGVFG